jgi:peptidoglycan hydrolase CwlO-like protein
MSEDRSKNGSKVTIAASAMVIGLIVIGLCGFMLSHTQAPAHSTAAVKMENYEKSIEEVKSDVKDIKTEVSNVQRSLDRVLILVERSP